MKHSAGKWLSILNHFPSSDPASLDSHWKPDPPALVERRPFGRVVHTFAESHESGLKRNLLLVGCKTLQEPTQGQASCRIPFVSTMNCGVNSPVDPGSLRAMNSDGTEVPKSEESNTVTKHLGTIRRSFLDLPRPSHVFFVKTIRPS